MAIYVLLYNDTFVFLQNIGAYSIVSFLEKKWISIDDVNI